MTVKVLHSRSQIKSARKQLRSMGASCLTPTTVRILRRLGLSHGINVGDYIKSWDVLETARFLLKYLPKDAPVLDLGAHCSEILHTLRRLGYSRLSGVDLNPNIRSMPSADAIQYHVSNFLESPFPDESFKGITAISVIEHGFVGTQLLSEISRLLAAGGYFTASFDYWPEKVDTSGIQLFGMDWKIFSNEEVLSFIQDASDWGLTPIGDIHLEATDKVVHWGNKSYTFAWIAFRKG